MMNCSKMKSAYISANIREKTSKCWHTTLIGNTNSPAKYLIWEVRALCLSEIPLATNQAMWYSRPCCYACIEIILTYLYYSSPIDICCFCFRGDLGPSCNKNSILDTFRAHFVTENKDFGVPTQAYFIIDTCNLH